jgi:hypothetical protein
MWRTNKLHDVPGTYFLAFPEQHAGCIFSLLSYVDPNLYTFLHFWVDVILILCVTNQVLVVCSLNCWYSRRL